MKTEPLQVGETSEATIKTHGRNRVISIFDFVLRIFAIIGTLGSAIAMGTTDQKLPFFTQFVQFRAEYNDIPTFT